MLSLSDRLAQEDRIEMATGYLVLALALAVMLNARNRWIRALGTALIALCLVMIIVSILLADLDGTFAAIPTTAPLIDRLKPVILNGQAAVAAIAIVFLGWSVWRQARRPAEAALPVSNSPSAYGRVSRYLHWTIAVLMFVLVPIGLFMAILPLGHSERSGFVATHQALGLTVLGLVVARISWLVFNPAPRPLPDLAGWELRASQGVHGALYLLLLLFPVSGYILSASEGEPIDFYGWTLPSVLRPSEPLSSVAAFLHNWLLPLIFYAAIALHAGAVAKRHFGKGDKHAIRRMLR
jgi:cytochrome b561